jgi:drug/metabolite transporter (DMT)-like permease
MATHVSLASGTYVFAKAAAVGFPDAETLVLARALGAAFLLLLLTGWVIPKPRFDLKEWLRILGFGILLVPLNQYLFLRGLRHTVPSHPALFYALTPLGVMILASGLNKKIPPKRKILGVLIAFVGVYIILRPWEGGETIKELRSGDFWVLAAMFAWVAYTVLAGRTCQNHDPRVVTAWSLILGAIVMTPIGGYSLLTIICTNAQPPTTAALSALMAGAGLLSTDQDLGPLFWLGMIIIISGVVLVQVNDHSS